MFAIFSSKTYPFSLQNMHFIFTVCDCHPMKELWEVTCFMLLRTYARIYYLCDIQQGSLSVPILPLPLCGDKKKVWAVQSRNLRTRMAFCDGISQKIVSSSVKNRCLSCDTVKLSGGHLLSQKTKAKIQKRRSLSQFVGFLLHQLLSLWSL